MNSICQAEPSCATYYFEGHESEAKCKEHNKSYERSTSLALVGQRRIWTHAREYEHGTSEYKHDAPPLQKHPCYMAFDNL